MGWAGSYPPPQTLCYFYALLQLVCNIKLVFFDDPLGHVTEKTGQF